LRVAARKRSSFLETLHPRAAQLGRPCRAHKPNSSMKFCGTRPALSLSKGALACAAIDHQPSTSRAFNWRSHPCSFILIICPGHNLRP
jgi:hypothetical protein